MNDITDRPDWDDYYMAQAFVIATRSIDTSTKCGCIVVSEDKTPLSQGYNSPPRGCDDAKVPMTRPEKYSYMAHAEENAIANAARVGNKLKGSTFYITAFPCSKCFREIKNTGAKKIVYGTNTAHMHTKEGSDIDDFEIIKFMNKDGQVEIVQYLLDPTYVFEKAMDIVKKSRS